MITQSQFLAFLRHAGSAVGGGIAAVSFFHLWQNPTDAQAAADGFNKIFTGAQQIWAGVGVLIPIVMGVIAAISANPIVQMIAGAHSVLSKNFDISKIPPEAQQKIVAAADKLNK